MMFVESSKSSDFKMIDEETLVTEEKLENWELTEEGEE